MDLGKLLIDGKWLETEDRLTSLNPATQQSIGQVCIASRIDVQKAAVSAKRSFTLWHKLTFRDRSKYLLRVREIIADQAKDLAELITAESGKPITEAISHEIFASLNKLTYLVKKSEKILKKEIVRSYQATLRGKRSFISFESLGVIGIIGPANYPFSAPMGLSLDLIASSLVVGNTVIFKPSEYTPFVGIKIGEIFKKANLPDGVLNIVLGPKKVGVYLIESDIDKIFFIGNADSGKSVFKSAAEKLHPVCLELGGKNAFIVLEDANLELAANAAVWGSFTNCGQACSAVRRLYVVESIAKEFIKLVVKKTNSLSIGDGALPDTDVGPLISEERLRNVEDYINDAISKGGRMLCGGRRLSKRKGFFFLPTVLVNVDYSMKVMTDEVLGPILPIMKVKDENEAINLANKSDYGLSASIWTKNIKKAEKLASLLNVGTVWINDINFVYPEVPWGGVKKSGFGKLNSKYGLLELVNIKHISLAQSKRRKDLWWFPYYKEVIDYYYLLTNLLFKKRIIEKIKLLGKFIKISFLFKRIFSHKDIPP